MRTTALLKKRPLSRRPNWGFEFPFADMAGWLIAVVYRTPHIVHRTPYTVHRVTRTIHLAYATGDSFLHVIIKYRVTYHVNTTLLNNNNNNRMGDHLPSHTKEATQAQVWFCNAILNYTPNA